MNTEAVARTHAIEPMPDGVLLDRGLAIAARTRGLTFIAFPAEVASAATLIDAWRGAQAGHPALKTSILRFVAMFISPY